jgi:hypothetical protein
MRYLDSVSGAILFFFGLVICLTSLRYPLGSLHSPGAGFFPLSASILLMALATVLVLTSFVKRKAMDGPKASFFSGKEAPRRILLAFLALVAYRYLLPILGFGPATFVFFSLVVKRLGHYSWRVSLLFSFLAALGAYSLFQVWLKVQMPVGMFNF